MPAQNQFSGTGILDGQIVEAPHVSQSVDAFRAFKDYDIIISGSLEVTGSVNLSGSLVNEYTGQFKTLGIGTAAPTSPIMLHVKSDDAGGNDPIVLIEGKTGTDSARLRLQNPDVSYDLGAYGSADDDFRIVQDNAFAAPIKTPFIIDKDTESYTLYLSGDSIGVGMGASSPSLLSALPAGSLQVLSLVTGSEIRGTVLSASAAGENIHGTASYATYIETAQTASYVKSTAIDFHFSISEDINANNTTSVRTGSFNHVKVNDISGIAFKNTNNANYSRVISGSTETNAGQLYVGNYEEDEVYMHLDNLNSNINFKNADVYMAGNAVVSDDLFISGSITPSIVIGPNGAPGSNNPSASLFANDLQFNRNNTAYIGNYNTDSTSKLQISAGGGGTDATMGIEVSASRDIKLSGSLNIVGVTPSNATDLQAYWNTGDTSASQVNENGRSGYYAMKPISTTNSAATTVMRIGFQSTSGTNYPITGVYCAHVKMCCLGTPSSGDGVYLEREFLIRMDGGVFSVLESGTLTRLNNNSIYNTATLTASSVNFVGSEQSIRLEITSGTSTTTQWTGWVEIKRVGLASS